MDGFIARGAGEPRPSVRRAADDPSCVDRPRRAGRHGLPRRARDPELLGATRSTSSSRTTCSSRTSWSLPAHLFLVSGWSARCSVKRRPDELHDARCRTPARRRGEPDDATGAAPHYAWTDLTYLLHRARRQLGLLRRRRRRAGLRGRRRWLCRAVPQNASTPGIWNPLPCSPTVAGRRAGRQRPAARRLLRAARARRRCPPSRGSSPSAARQRAPTGASSSDGQAYVTSLVNAVMRGPDWARPRSSWPGTTGAASTTTSSPPQVDENGYGLRVPGPRDQPVRAARLHRPPDAELRRLPEVHRGRLPRRRSGSTRDRRPARPAARRARERAACSATSRSDFDFSQPPRPPLLLRPRPHERGRMTAAAVRPSRSR